MIESIIFVNNIDMIAPIIPKLGVNINKKAICTRGEAV